MADAVIMDVCLWIGNVGCGLTRRALLALEPGSRIWLSVDDVPLLFERMQDGLDGRSTHGLKPIGPSKEVWLQRYRTEKVAAVELKFVERPVDRSPAEIV